MMKKRQLPLWAVILIDILLTGIVLVVFAYFHHVRPRTLESENVVIARSTVSVTAAPTATPAATAVPVVWSEATVTPEPTATPEPTPDPEGVFASKFADKFTSGDPVTTVDGDTRTYVGQNVNVTITKSSVETTYGTAVYWLTDFYVKDITCLTSAFANDKFASGNYEWLTSFASRTNAVAAVNGDYCTVRNNGLVIRNGVLYRSKHSNLDICVIYWNGEMECLSPEDWSDVQTLVDKGAYLGWSFGPMLLDADGNTMTSFNDRVDGIADRNPRTVIGYFEPGHYCFVTVDGRSNTSKGLKLTDLSKLMYSLGCKAAYNLDGGQSTSLTWFDTVVNSPYKDGRELADAVMVVDSVTR